MSNLLKAGSDWLEAERAEHCTQTVEYVAAAGGSVSVAATIGRSAFARRDEDYGTEIEERSRDYLILAADLDVGAGPIEPAAGDQIRETVGSAVKVYEVLSPGDAPVWEWSDPHFVTRRIHTKLVDEE